jgi:hypothetical protein
MRQEICNEFQDGRKYADLYCASGITRIIIEVNGCVCHDESSNGHLQLLSNFHQADPWYIEPLRMHTPISGYSPHNVLQPRALRSVHAA